MDTKEIILWAIASAFVLAFIVWIFSFAKAAKRGDERPEIEPLTPDTEHWDNYTTYRTNITHEQAN